MNTRREEIRKHLSSLIRVCGKERKRMGCKNEVKPLPQPRSSLPSRQSKILSHLRRKRTQPPSSQRISVLGSHSLLRSGVQRGSGGSERIHTHRHIQGKNPQQGKWSIEQPEIKFKGTLAARRNAFTFYHTNATIMQPRMMQ